MEEEKVRRFLEKGEAEENSHGLGQISDDPPSSSFETFVMQGLKPLLIEPGRLICSFIVPPRLLNTDGGSLHKGATAMLVDILGSGAITTLTNTHPNGVSVEINISYFGSPSIDEEIEIEAKALHVGQSVGVSSVEFRKNGKIIAQGRHTKYLAVPMPSKI